MNFVETSISGVYWIKPEPVPDDRGLFARTFCVREFNEARLETRFVQESTSFNRERGTLRGLHHQEPSAEVKVVRCTRGRIFDVVVDVRQNSATRGKWFSAELTQDNRQSLYIPAGCAHGFQTLEPDSEVFYLISEFFDPTSAKTIRYDDPALGILWPLPITKISDRDLKGSRF